MSYKSWFVVAALVLLLPGLAAAAQEFTLHSRDMDKGKFTEAQALSATFGFGCSGDNTSPQLYWENPPAGTKSFLLLLRDEDAPTTIGWTHWTVANIPATAKELAAGAGTDPKKLPAGALLTRTDFGKPGYGGPCPQVGEVHRYVLTLYALDTDKLDVNSDTMPSMMMFLAKKHSLGIASLTALQTR